MAGRLLERSKRGELEGLLRGRDLWAQRPMELNLVWLNLMWLDLVWLNLVWLKRTWLKPMWRSRSPPKQGRNSVGLLSSYDAGG
jgi:hypothetical protein